MKKLAVFCGVILLGFIYRCPKCIASVVPIHPKGNQDDVCLFSSSQPVVKILRDRLGNKIGSIEIRPDGIQVGRDRLGDKVGDKVGEYDPKGDVTRDRLGNKFGGGNLLAALIVRAKDKDGNVKNP